MQMSVLIYFLIHQKWTFCTKCVLGNFLKYKSFQTFCLYYIQIYDNFLILICELNFEEICDYIDTFTVSHYIQRDFIGLYENPQYLMGRPVIVLNKIPQCS